MSACRIGASGKNRPLADISPLLAKAEANARLVTGANGGQRWRQSADRQDRSASGGRKVSAFETNQFASSLNDPDNLEAVRAVRKRRKLLARLLSNKWVGLAAIVCFALEVLIRREPQDYSSIILLGLLAAGWIATSTPLLSFGRMRERRRRASPSASCVVRLLPDGVALTTARLPDRLIPWSTLDLLEREGDRLVLFFRFAPLVPLEILVVPQHAFSGPDDFAQFCSMAASLASKAGKTRLYVA